MAQGTNSVVYHKYAKTYVYMYMYKAKSEALMTTNNFLRSRVKILEGKTKRLENVIANRTPETQDLAEIMNLLALKDKKIKALENSHMSQAFSSTL